MTDRVEVAVRELVDALRDELRPEPAATPAVRLLSIDEASRTLGIGRSALYDLLASRSGRRLRSVKVGRRRLVPSDAIADYIAGAGS